jgi:hypothetical protein
MQNKLYIIYIPQLLQYKVYTVMYISINNTVDFRFSQQQL